MLKAVKTEVFPHQGYGGRKILVTTAEKETARYLVKCEECGQSINEVIAHSFLRVLGYNTPDAQIIYIPSTIIAEGNHDALSISAFGGVEYVSEAQAFAANKNTIGSLQDKTRIYELIILNSLLENMDGMLQLMTDERLGIFLVDLGETLVSSTDIKVVLTAGETGVEIWKKLEIITRRRFGVVKTEQYLKDGRASCIYYSEDESDINMKSIDAAMANVLRKISVINLTRMRGCLRDLEQTYGTGLVECYKAVFRQLRYSCRLILKYNE